MELLHLVMFAAALTGAGWMLLSRLRRRAGRWSPPAARDTYQDLQTRSAGAVREIAREMELRVYEYGRTVEARIESHLQVLDQLILDADREICRLEGILAESRYDLVADRPLSRSEQQRCFALHEAGFSIEEAARCLNTSSAQVRVALDEWQPGQRRAA